MRPPLNKTTNIPARRTLAVSAIVLFVGVFFALPLYAALMICTMPCCDHDTGTAGPVVSAGMTACATECVIRTDDATATSAPAIAPEKRANERAAVTTTPIAMVDSPTVTDAGDREAIDGSRAGAPVHLLNSVFRI